MQLDAEEAAAHSKECAVDDVDDAAGGGGGAGGGAAPDRRVEANSPTRRAKIPDKLAAPVSKDAEPGQRRSGDAVDDVADAALPAPAPLPLLTPARRWRLRFIGHRAEKKR